MTGGPSLRGWSGAGTPKPRHLPDPRAFSTRLPQPSLEAMSFRRDSFWTAWQLAEALAVAPHVGQDGVDAPRSRAAPLAGQEGERQEREANVNYLDAAPNLGLGVRDTHTPEPHAVSEVAAHPCVGAPRDKPYSRSRRSFSAALRRRL